MFKFNELNSVHLEITTRCQASCPMCPRNYHGGQENTNLKIADWSYYDFVKVFDAETLAQLSNIYFCGNFGDPIINDNLIDMCQHIKDCAPHIDLKIHTNGAARGTKWWQSLCRALPEKHCVLFGIDGLEDTHHLYRVGTSYENVIRNAKEFISNGGHAEWVFIKFKHNEHQVEEAEKRSKELGFEQFTVKNTIRFIGEPKFDVLDKIGNVKYQLEPPTANEVVLIDAFQIEKFKKIYDRSIIDCHALAEKKIYIDAHMNVFPCCFLASTPYKDNRIHPILSEVNEKTINQYKELIESLGGIKQIDAKTRSVKDIIDSTLWQNVWEEYWTTKKLVTCFKICGNTDMAKPKDQVVKQVKILKEGM